MAILLDVVSFLFRIFSGDGAVWGESMWGKEIDSSMFGISEKSVFFARFIEICAKPKFE